MSHPDLETATSASLLDDVRIASPCKASWDEMVGDDRVRFCGECAKNVYNLSALSRDAAEALLRGADARGSASGEGMCVRLYRRADGTVLTADCPEGARRKRRRLALFGAVGGGLMAAGAAVAAAELSRPAPMQSAVATTSQGGATMGEPLRVDPVPTTTPVTTTPAPPTTTTGLVAVRPPKPVVAPSVPKNHGHMMGGSIVRPKQGPTVPLMGDIGPPVGLMGKVTQGAL